RQYERLLGLPTGTLLYGPELSSECEVPIVGIICTDSSVGTVITQLVDNNSTRAPVPVSNLVAHRVVGDDLYPAYRDGDEVFHQKLCPDRYKLEDLDGVECIVQLDDGR